MSKEQPTVADLFRRAQELRRDNPQLSYKDLRKHLADEYRGAPFPPTHNLTIPEQDARAPEEDWTAGLPLVLRGIQMKNWDEVAAGIVLSLEQTEGYERARGGAVEPWHDRTVGIAEPLKKGVGKWLPDELVALAERSSPKR
jgi:hypothetical protein